MVACGFACGWAGGRVEVEAQGRDAFFFLELVRVAFADFYVYAVVKFGKLGIFMAV